MQHKYIVFAGRVFVPFVLTNSVLNVICVGAEYYANEPSNEFMWANILPEA